MSIMMMKPYDPRLEGVIKVRYYSEEYENLPTGYLKMKVQECIDKWEGTSFSSCYIGPFPEDWYKAQAMVMVLRDRKAKDVLHELGIPVTLGERVKFYFTNKV